MASYHYCHPLYGTVMMLPSKMVLARMLPGKSANTFTIYVDTATNASIAETKSLTSCIVNQLKSEKEITDMEFFLGQGAPLDYAGLVKGSALKSLKNQAEIVINLTDKHGRDEPSFMMVHRIRPILNKRKRDREKTSHRHCHSDTSQTYYADSCCHYLRKPITCYRPYFWWAWRSFDIWKHGYNLSLTLFYTCSHVKCTSHDA